MTTLLLPSIRRHAIKTAFVLTALSASMFIPLNSGCRGKPDNSGPSNLAPVAPRRIRTAAVESTDLGETVFIPALVASVRRATLSPRVPAAIAALPRRVGERVRAGDVVARLDDAAARSGVAAAEASVASTGAEALRLTGLRSKGAATTREVESATARAAAATAALEGARAELAYAVLRAPFSGVITKIPVHAGDVVSPGGGVVELEGEEGFEIQAAVEPDIALRWKAGDRLAVRIDGEKEIRTATVRSLSTSADPSTHRFDLRADLSANRALRSGLFARIETPRAVGEARLFVPTSAIVERGGLTGVYVVSDGRALLRWIAAGEAAADRIEARSGLAPGERIALDTGELSDGCAVVEAGR